MQQYSFAPVIFREECIFKKEIMEAFPKTEDFALMER